MNASVKPWIERCINGVNLRLIEAQDISGGSGCQVWDCRVELAEKLTCVILKIYGADFEDYSQLGVHNTIRKNIFALQEFPKYSVPTVSVLGHAEFHNEAAILLEKVHAQTWQHRSRIEAARILANLHSIPLDELGTDITPLVLQSTPNRQRVFLSLEMADALDQKVPIWRSTHPDLLKQIDQLKGTGEPISDLETLVHGDFFSANILLGENGLSVIDWDLLALGDPMWDLGFLIGADQNMTSQEVDDTILTYKEQCPVDMDVLMWHKHCWDASWKLRRVRKQLL